MRGARRGQRWTGRLGLALIYLAPLVFLACFFFYPLGNILRVSLVGADGRDWSALGAALGRPRIRQVLGFSLWQALLSTAATLLLGIPTAFVFARYRWRGKTVLRSLATVPFVLPTVVVAAAFSALVGRTGLLNTLAGRPWLSLDRTLTVLVLAHVFYNFTVVLRIVGGFWANLDPRLAAAAQVLGAPRWRVLREITLPLLAPVVGAAALLIFLFAFSAFGTVLLLGPAGSATLEVQIYIEAVQLLNLPLAAVLALLQLVVALALTVAYTRLQARTGVPLDLRPQQAQELPVVGRRRVALGVVVVGMVVLLGSPLAALVIRTLTLEGGWSLHLFAVLAENRANSFFFVPPLAAIRNSLVFAMIATLLALALGLPAAYLLASNRRTLRAILDPLFMLPLGTSAVTLGFGYLITLDHPPLNLRTSPALIPLAHALVAFPFVVRTLVPVLRGLDPRLRQAARTLGASPRRVVWEVDVPIVGRTVLVAAAFAFTISLGEFGATLLLNPVSYPTMPLVINRFLARPGRENYGQALAMSTLLMLVTALSLVVIERLRVGDSEF